MQADRYIAIDSREGFDEATAAEYNAWLDHCNAIGDEDEPDEDDFMSNVFNGLASPYFDYEDEVLEAMDS